MVDKDLKLVVKSLCHDVSEKVLGEFFARMDDDYFDTFSAEDIALHVRMSVELSSARRVHVQVTPRSASEFDIIIVGFDYLSEFSILCGLLSAFGLDIRAGNIYSFARDKASRHSSQKIVDVFRVGLKPGESFDVAKQHEFQHEMQVLAQMLASGNADQARERLNRFLTERIEQMNEPLSGLVHPIEIDFDNTSSREWTVMEVRSEDAFALLYAMSNALAMQGIYIHKVKIRSIGHEARDHFYIADRWGRRIEDAAQQQRLRTTIAMIKHFTRFLPHAADPAKAMRHFDQFLDKLADENFPDHVMSFLSRSEGMNLLARLLGSSDYLWDEFLRIHFLDLFPFLERLSHKERMPLAITKDALQRELDSRLEHATTFDQRKQAVNRFKDDQVFLIDLQHLADPHATLLEFSLALTDLAEIVVDRAVRICSEDILDGKQPPLTVCGLGKLGGREMGYASDLEVMFVHEADGDTSTSMFEALVRRVTEFIESREKGIFQIDLRLRPYGDAGVWSLPFDEFERYYSSAGAAAPFERQALIKLRWIGGDEALGRRVEAHRDRFTYSGAAWDWANAHHLRQRQMRELVRPGRTNVKYSAGGIVDVEYTVQYLQLLHGKQHPELRCPNTLDALDELRRLGIVSEPEYDVLRPAYLFLRNLIDALRIVRGDASDLLLPDESSDEYKSLARRLGYRDQDRSQAASRLSADIRASMNRVHKLFENRFG